MQISTKRWLKSVLILFSSFLLIGATILFAGLSGLTVTGSETYTDPNELTISNSTVELGGNLTLKAGEKIRLLPGFHAKEGSYLTAKIDPGLQRINFVMPPTTGNDRFMEESYVQMERPGLPIIGFDNNKDNSKDRATAKRSFFKYSII